MRAHPPRSKLRKPDPLPSIPSISLTPHWSLLLLISLLPYLLTLQNPKHYLNNWDDYDNFVANPYTRELSLRNMWWHWYDGVVFFVYEPISMLFKTLIRSTGGGKLSTDSLFILKRI